MLKVDKDGSLTAIRALSIAHSLIICTPSSIEARSLSRSAHRINITDEMRPPIAAPNYTSYGAIIPSLNRHSRMALSRMTELTHATVARRQNETD
jgi:hypothetical protein